MAIHWNPLMLIVHIHIHVLPEHRDAFIAATLTNVRASRQEPGIAQFDLLQHHDDPTRFVLVEAYRTPDAPAAHKATAHYATWRDTVAPMTATPRTSTRFTALHPTDTL